MSQVVEKDGALRGGVWHYTMVRRRCAGDTARDLSQPFHAGTARARARGASERASAGGIERERARAPLLARGMESLARLPCRNNWQVQVEQRQRKKDALRDWLV